MPFPKEVLVIQDEDEPEIMIIVDGESDVDEGHEYGVYVLKKVLTKKFRKQKDPEVSNDMEGIQ